jgi:outer membrane receptor protein involved in Fe transport
MKRHLSGMQYGKGWVLPTENRNPGEPRNEIHIPFAQVPELGLELARLMRDVKVQETVYTLLTQQLEQAKSAEARDMPTVQSSIYADGYAFEGRPITHFIGTRGKDFYVRIGRWFGPDVLVGLEFDRSKIGLVTAGGTNLPREKRYVAGLDVSYRFSKWLTLFGGYRFTRSDNQGSVPDLDLDNYLLRVEATFSF